MADYKPIKTLVLDLSEISRYDTWSRQRLWHHTSIEMINDYEKDNNIQFDFFINIRFDLELTPNLLKTLQVDKINICYKHPSGNCDDNLFIFPRAYFATFKAAIDQLIKNNRITHEISNFLPGSSIHYLCPGLEYTQIFTILRSI